MAKEGGEKDQITIPIPMRRLITGVPRTKRAPSAIPRIKRYVLRHIDSEWRDAIWDEDRGQHRIWIDDFLNQTIWSRGRGHIGGPMEWTPGKDGGKPRLSKRTASRYGSILKVKVLFVEEPGEGGDPRVDVYLYGHEDEGKDEEEEGKESKETQDEDDGDDEQEKPAAKAPSDAPAKKPASTSAAGKGDKAAAPKADAKKAPAKPKKEGGD